MTKWDNHRTRSRQKKTILSQEGLYSYLQIGKKKHFFKIFQLLNNFLIIGQKQVQRIGKWSFLKVVKLQLQHYYETTDWNIKNRGLTLNLNAQIFLNNRASEKIRILSTCAGSMLTLCDSQWPSGQNCLLESLEWSCRTRQVTSYWEGKQLLCQRTV